MAANFGKQNLDLNFATLACAGKIICDHDANFNVNNVNIQGNLLVDGAVVSPPWQSFPLVTWNNISTDTGNGVVMTADASWESIAPLYFVKDATLSSLTLNPDDTVLPSGNGSVEFWTSNGTHIGTALFTGNALSQATTNAPWGSTWVESQSEGEVVTFPVTVPVIETTVGSLNVAAGTSVYARCLKGTLNVDAYMICHVNLV